MPNNVLNTLSVKNQGGILRLVRLILLILVTIGCITIVWKRSDLFSALTNLSFVTVLFILTAKLIVALSNCLKFRAVTRLFDLYLSKTEWIGLTVVTTLYAGLLPARLGIVPRAIYLKRKYGFRYTNYLSLTAGNSIVDLVVASFTGLVVGGFSNINEIYRSFILSVFAISLFILISFVIMIRIIIRFRFITGWKKFDEIVQRIQMSLEQYRHNPRKLGHHILAAVFNHMAKALALLVCFISIGFTPEPLIVLMIVSFVRLAAFVTITPGNIGITEGAIVWTAVMAGIGSDISLPASVVSRIGSIIVQTLLGLIYSHILFGKIFVQEH